MPFFHGETIYKTPIDRNVRITLFSMWCQSCCFTCSEAPLLEAAVYYPHYWPWGPSLLARAWSRAVFPVKEHACVPYNKTPLYYNIIFYSLFKLKYHSCLLHSHQHPNPEAHADTAVYPPPRWPNQEDCFHESIAQTKNKYLNIIVLNAFNI